MQSTLALTAVAGLALAAVWLTMHRFRHARRKRTMASLLDAADHLEARLRTARVEIAAIAGDDHDPIRAAMQEMLRQRLWLQQHGKSSPQVQLASVRDSILEATSRIDQQLAQIERVRARLQ